MALNTDFEAYKVKRELMRSGNDYTFYRSVKNEFGEPSQESKYIGILRAIYHEENSRVEVTGDNVTRTRTEYSPCLLCLYDDVQKLNLMPDDFCYINGNKYDVLGTVNIQQWGIIADVSLEVVDNGKF